MRPGWWVVTGRLVVLGTPDGSGHSRVSPATTVNSPRKRGEDLASDVALQAAKDLPRRQPLRSASFEVGDGAWLALGQAGQHDVPQGAVGVSVAALVEPVTTAALAG